MGLERGVIGTDSDGSAVGRMRRWALVGRGEQRFGGRDSVYVVTRDSFTKYTTQSRE